MKRHFLTKKAAFVIIFLFSALFLQNMYGMRAVYGLKDGHVQIWDIEKDSVEKMKVGFSSVESVSIDPSNSNIIAVGFDSGIIRTWDIKTKTLIKQWNVGGERKHISDRDHIDFLRFTSSGLGYIAVRQTRHSNRYDIVRIFGLYPDKIKKNTYSKWVLSCFAAYDNFGRLLIGSDYGVIEIFDFKKKKRVDLVYGPIEDIPEKYFYLSDDLRHDDTAGLFPVSSLSFFHSDANYMAVGTEEGLIYIWNIEKRECVKALRVAKEDVYFVGFYLSRKNLMFVTEDGVIRIFDIEKEEIIKEIKNDCIESDKITSVAIWVPKKVKDTDEPARIEFLKKPEKIKQFKLKTGEKTFEVPSLFMGKKGKQDVEELQSRIKEKERLERERTRRHHEWERFLERKREENEEETEGEEVE